LDVQETREETRRGARTNRAATAALQVSCTEADLSLTGDFGHDDGGDMRLGFGADEFAGFGFGAQEPDMAGTQRTPDRQQVASMDGDIGVGKTQPDDACGIIAGARRSL